MPLNTGYLTAKTDKASDGVAFGCCYLCKGFLPKDLIIEELNRGV